MSLGKFLKRRWALIVLTMIALGQSLFIALAYVPLKRAPAGPIGFRVYQYGANDYLIEGTWLADFRLAYPLNVSEIRCIRSLNLCIEAQSWIYDSLLSSDLKFHDVKKWTEDEIVFGEGDRECENSPFVFDIRKETVSCSKTGSIKPSLWLGDGFATYRAVLMGKYGDTGSRFAKDR